MVGIFGKMLKQCLIATPLVVTFCDKVGHPSSIIGSSMEPTLLGDFRYWWDRDFVWLNRWSVRTFDVQRGDIVTFIHPKRPNEHYIKRVVGVEGDVIAPSIGVTHVVVPTGACWVEPDNRTSGEGSADFGPVCLGLITGKATWVIWPKERWRRISSDLSDDRKPVTRLPILAPGYSDPDEADY